MYSKSKFSTRPPSPTFVKFSPPSDYPTSHHLSMSKGVSSQTLGACSEITFPEETGNIEFCVRDNTIHRTGDSFSDRRRRSHIRRSNHKMEVEQQVKWTRENIAATMERFEPTSKDDFSTIQQPVNHVYSYAYYEPGIAKCHTNIPHKDLSSSTITPEAGPSKTPARNSIKALLAKSFRSKTLAPSSSEERHTYTTRYGTQENLYEEVNDQKIRKVLSDNRIVSVNSTMVKEELRRVQHNHFRVLDELNLSLEALIMPPTPPDISPIEDKQSHMSMENLSSTMNTIELKDHTCINPEFDEGDLDSGFSGSGSSSGASYNESLRYYKTGAVMQTRTLPHMRSCRSSTSNTSTSKSSMHSEEHAIGMMTSSGLSPFTYARRCSDSQRSCVGRNKPKKNFWVIKQ